MFTATILGWLVLFAVPPPDCQQEKDAKKVKVTVVVILANECCDHVDPALVLIADEVRKKNPNLKGFTLASMTCDSLEVEKKAVFKLVDDKTAEIIIIQPADKNDRVVLAVKPPMQGPIVYRTVCGKFLPIVTPVRMKNDELVIIAIRVQPCNGK